MLYANPNKIHGYILLACIASFLISPSYNQKFVQAKSEETNTGKVETRLDAPVQMSGAIDKKKQYYVWWWLDKVIQESCWVDCKIKHLENIWIIPEIAESLVQNCKNIADDPRKCILVWASIVIAESGGWKNCRKNNKWNCFGIMQDNKYKSYSDATLHFSWKFQKWWRNAESMSFFYPPAWQLSRSRYCTSEDSSGSSIWCPNWLKNSSAVFKKLDKLF